MDKSVDSFWHYIYSWIQDETLGAPLLITGHVGADWEKFLTHVRAAAVCTTSQAEPCLSCAACKQAQGNIHTDIVTLEGDEKIIRVSHVRDIRETLHRTPLGKRRLIIIPRAERLHTEAANMLLKELEESTKSNRFLLTTSFKSRVLPTIRSRCQSLALPSEFATHATTMSLQDASAAIQEVTSQTKREALTEEELSSISGALQAFTSQGKVSPITYRALLRLRDYYKIRALRGNEKLAADVLLASLSQLGNNSHKQS